MVSLASFSWAAIDIWPFCNPTGNGWGMKSMPPPLLENDALCYNKVVVDSNNIVPDITKKMLFSGGPASLLEKHYASKGITRQLHHAI